MVIKWLKSEPTSTINTPLVPHLVYISLGQRHAVPSDLTQRCTNNTPPCQSIVQGSNQDHFNINKRGPKDVIPQYFMIALYIGKLQSAHLHFLIIGTFYNLCSDCSERVFISWGLSFLFTGAGALKKIYTVQIVCLFFSIKLAKIVTRTPKVFMRFVTTWKNPFFIILQQCKIKGVSYYGRMERVATLTFMVLAYQMYGNGEMVPMSVVQFITSLTFFR